MLIATLKFYYKKIRFGKRIKLKLCYCTEWSKEYKEFLENYKENK